MRSISIINKAKKINSQNAFYWPDGKLLYKPKDAQDFKNALTYLTLDVLEAYQKDGRLTSMLKHFFPKEDTGEIELLVLDRIEARKLKRKKSKLFRMRNGESLPQKSQYIEYSKPEKTKSYDKTSIVEKGIGHDSEHMAINRSKKGISTIKALVVVDFHKLCPECKESIMSNLLKQKKKNNF